MQKSMCSSSKLVDLGKHGFLASKYLFYWDPLSFPPQAPFAHSPFSLIWPLRAPRLDCHLPVTFSGGMKTDATGHHAFLFLRRAGVGMRWYSWLPKCESSPCPIYQHLITHEISKDFLSDVPRNIIIKHDEKYTGFIPHEMDVICFVKRNASDSNLDQASWRNLLTTLSTKFIRISWNQKRIYSLNILRGVHASKEAILAMPYQFMQPILHSSPEEPRPLKRLEAVKRQRYTDLAQVMLTRFPSTSSQRGIEFLLDLCNCTDPGLLAPIPFYATPGQRDLVVLRPAAVVRVAPTIRFRATINRRRWKISVSPQEKGCKISDYSAWLALSLELQRTGHQIH